MCIQNCSSTLLTFLLSIIVVFSVGHFVRGVTLPWIDWLVIGVMLLVGSVSLSAWGSCELLPSTQLMTVIGNIAYIALAVLGELWFPLSSLPRMAPVIGKLTPTYQLMPRLSLLIWAPQFNILYWLY